MEGIKVMDLCYVPKFWDLCYVPKFWVFEDEVFYWKGVDLDQLIVKRGWFIERWEVEDSRIIPIYIYFAFQLAILL